MRAELDVDRRRWLGGLVLGLGLVVWGGCGGGLLGRGGAKGVGAHGARGWLVVGHYRDYNDGFHDIGLLAELGGGEIIERPASAACEVLTRGRVIRRLRLSLEVERFALDGELFSNEANTCVAYHDGLGPGHFVASLGVETRPLRTRAPTMAERRAVEARVVAALRAQEPSLSAANYAISFNHHAFTQGPRWLDAVDVAFRARPGCRAASCRVRPYCDPRDPQQTAVVLVEGESRRILYTELRGIREDDYRGRVRFVDALLPRGAVRPWLVLFNDGCEAWDFTLVVPGREGFRAVATGGAASTI